MGRKVASAKTGRSSTLRQIIRMRLRPYREESIKQRTKDRNQQNDRPKEEDEEGCFFLTCPKPNNDAQAEAFQSQYHH